MVRQFSRSDFDFDFVECLHRDAAELFSRCSTDEFEWDLDRNFLTLFDHVKISVDELRSHRMDVYVVDQGVFCLTCTFEFYDSGLASFLPNASELHALYCDRGG